MLFAILIIIIITAAVFLPKVPRCLHFCTFPVPPLVLPFPAALCRCVATSRCPVMSLADSMELANQDRATETMEAAMKSPWIPSALPSAFRRRDSVPLRRCPVGMPIPSAITVMMAESFTEQGTWNANSAKPTALVIPWAVASTTATAMEAVQFFSRSTASSSDMPGPMLRPSLLAKTCIPRSGSIQIVPWRSTLVLIRLLLIWEVLLRARDIASRQPWDPLLRRSRDRKLQQRKRRRRKVTMLWGGIWIMMSGQGFYMTAPRLMSGVVWSLLPPTVLLVAVRSGMEWVVVL
mmetsp:Transcript_15945/g.38107  ORF Transcript_15945/g.38107 Transcript_15945/m.38107 type:complete len:292 (-) Transcript_15945:2036-2911(-)